MRNRALVVGQGRRRPAGTGGRGTWLWMWLACAACAAGAGAARAQAPGLPGAPAPMPPPPAIEPVQGQAPNTPPPQLPGGVGNGKEPDKGSLPPPNLLPRQPVGLPSTDPAPALVQRDLRFPMPPGPHVIGTTPTASPETVQRYNQRVGPIIDPEMTLDLVVGRTRLMVLRAVPKRIQIADETLALYNLISPTEVSVMG